jgi:hypothetical protein
MRGVDTAAAVKAAVLFFREQNVDLDTIRMDNQSSPEVRAVANDLKLKWELVNPYQKEPNRAERAIKTGKNHIIAVRAGFHRECPTTFIDRCMFQIELTLNLMHPFEYDPNMSAHHDYFANGLISHNTLLHQWGQGSSHGIARTPEAVGLIMECPAFI